jgi:hypothetical protein
MDCGSVWDWDGITGDSQCSRWKADIAFCFLASIFFLASCLLGIYVVHYRRSSAAADRRASHRYRWYRTTY